jgi:hypothetical protein
MRSARPILACEGHALRRTIGKLIEQPPEPFTQALVGKRRTLEFTLNQRVAIARFVYRGLGLLCMRPLGCLLPEPDWIG